VSDVGEIYEEAIGAAAFTRGHGVGFAEACRLYLARRGIAEHELPLFYCRLSEALLHRGCREDAVECARMAFDLRPAKEDTANLCAWVFSNCGRHDEAAAAYERLQEFRPHWAEGHRHASGSFAAAEQIDRATFHGRSASDLDTNSFEFAFHAACLLESAGLYEDAVEYFTRAAAIEPHDSAALRHLSTLQFALEQRDAAVATALRAASLAPGDRLNALHATELLLRTGRFDEAADIVLDAIDIHSRDDAAFRLLSAAHMLRGQIEDALDAIDRALALAPQVVEYHLHRATFFTVSGGSTRRQKRSAGPRHSIRRTQSRSDHSSPFISTVAGLPKRSPLAEN
jgi:tetratricopeptide (TPR) repeat protein